MIGDKPQERRSMEMVPLSAAVPWALVGLLMGFLLGVGFAGCK